MKITRDHSGHVYVLDNTNCMIRRVDALTGQTTTVADCLPTPQVAASAPYLIEKATALLDGLAVDDAGNVYFTVDRTVQRLALDTGKVTPVAGLEGEPGNTDGVGPEARFWWPQGFALDDQGDLYLADSPSCAVRKIVLATGAVTTLAGSQDHCVSLDGVGQAAGFDYPVSLTFDPSGRLYVIDGHGSTLRQVTIATGRVATLAGKPKQANVLLGPLPGGLATPRGVTVLPNGAIALLDDNAVLLVK
jgi:sugar lactone lactonase YvrE